MTGNDTDNSPGDAGSTPVDAFALVGHEIRMEIIRELGDPDKEAPDLSFGELRSQLNCDVDPSQLHYHLKQLLGHFVTKTDGRYRLNAAGIRLCLDLHAETFDNHYVHISVGLDFDCYYCQAPTEAIFSDEGIVGIVCSECEHSYGGSFLELPLGAFMDGDALFSFPHFRKYTALKTLFIARGVCPSCAHPLSPTFHPPDWHPEPRKVDIHLSCALCGLIWEVSVGRALLADPELRTFCHEYGLDILTTPWWELEFAATDKHVTVRSTDPWEVALEVTFDGDTLELVVNGDLNVVERNRRRSAHDSTSVVRDIQGGDHVTGGRENDDLVILPDRADCLQYLRRHRWPDGVTCPHCSSTDTIKKGTTSKDTQRYRCHTCEGTFTDLTGTVFAERRLSLSEMFHIVWEMDETKLTQIAQQLDRSSQTIQDFVHTVQDTLAEDAESELSGVCSADDVT